MNPNHGHHKYNISPASRIIRVISSVQRLMFSATSTEELYRSFCRVLVLQSGVLSVGVGPAREDCKFAPMFEAWGTAEDLQQRSYSKNAWDSDQLIVCKALETRETECSECGCAVGELKKWEESQGNQMILQVFCVPLVHNGVLTHVVRVCFDKPAFKDIDLLDLANELAQSLAFALSAIQDRSLLCERMKELECIIDISQHFYTVQTISDSHLKYLVERLPAAFHRPENTGARLIFNGSEFTTDHFDPNAHVLSFPIEVGSDRVSSGFIEVSVSGDMEYPFLNEETPLLETIARMIGEVVSHQNSLKMLNQHQKLLDVVFNAFPVAITMFTPVFDLQDKLVDFKLKLYNPAAVNVLRCKCSVVVGASLRNDISCMSNIGFYDRFASVMSSRKDLEFEQRVDHNGEVRWLRVVAKRCQDGIVATMEDISSKKRTESELIEYAKNFRAVLESAPDGLSIVEVETGNFMENNAETCRKLGYDNETLRHLSVRDIDPNVASHWEETKAGWRQIVRDNVRTVIVTKHQRKDGSLYDAEVSVAPITYRGRSCIIGTIRDVTERLRSESQMRMMSKALDGAANLIVITDPDANILYVNPAFSKVTGYSGEEVLGNNPRILKSGKHDQVFYDKMWSVLRTGENWQGTLVNQCKNGREIYVETVITPVFDNTDTLTHYIAVQEDVTEKLQLEQQFQRAQRMEVMGLMAGGVAHDLNNILTPLLLAVDVLKSSPTPKQQENVLNTVEDSVQRGAGIIRQILTFARGTEGEKQHFKMQPLLKEVIKLISETFPRSIRIRSKIANDISTLFFDPNQLHQIAMNLVVNARDAMPNGGVITIGAENVSIEKPMQFLNLVASPGAYVRLFVEDTGMGIDKKQIEHIFDPFYTTKSEGKGTGLGLSTILGIIKSNRGMIHVNSEKGKGTCVDIFIPVAQEDAEPQEAISKEKTVLQGNGEHILLVDDEIEILNVTAAILQANGYVTSQAKDGTEAIALIASAKEPFAAVVSDLMMPFMDGISLKRATIKLDPTLPFILSSGMLDADFMDDKVKELKAMGVNNFLVKPYKSEALLIALNKVVRKPSC